MFLVFDTETTDLPDWGAPNPGMSKARIVQLACTLLTPEFDEVAAFCSLIKLPPGVNMSPNAESRHGISLEKCQKYGIPIESALTIFDEFSKLADYVVAHGLKFDSYLLATEVMITGRPLYNIENGTSGICTMLASTKICGLKQQGSNRPKWPKLEEAAEILLGLKMTDAHDALYDTRTTGKVLRHLLHNKHISLPRTELSQP